MNKLTIEKNKKVGDLITVNDITTDCKLQIVKNQEFNTIPINLVIEVDGEVNWYLNPERTDKIIKTVEVVIPEESDDETINKLIEELYNKREKGLI